MDRDQYTLTNVVGKVAVCLQARGPEWVDVKDASGARLYEGDRLLTGQNSGVTLITNGDESNPWRIGEMEYRCIGRGGGRWEAPQELSAPMSDGMAPRKCLRFNDKILVVEAQAPGLESCVPPPQWGNVWDNIKKFAAG